MYTGANIASGLSEGDSLLDSPLSVSQVPRSCIGIQGTILRSIKDTRSNRSHHTPIPKLGVRWLAETTFP